MITPIKNCTAVILAGGENKRMPVLKAFIEVDGETIIKKNLKILKEHFRHIYIVTNQPGAYSDLNALLLGDIYPTRGPMTGIVTSLLNSSSSWIFVSACDMPFINRDLIRYMASLRADCDAVVPVTQDKTEPLFALYSKRLLPSMEKSLLMNKKSLSDFLRKKRVKYITIEKLKQIDPEAVSFVNLNTPEDVNRYLKSEDRLRFNKKSRGGENVRTRSN